MPARIGGLPALLVTHANFSVSSGVGFWPSLESPRKRASLMTILMATLGLLPAAMSHGIGSDSQRPFAIVIVGGLMSDLVMSIFLLPTLYVWMAGEHDVPPALDALEPGGRRRGLGVISLREFIFRMEKVCIDERS
jgi:cobalt-zinc-cadmium resistance protein CzcA